MFQIKDLMVDVLSGDGMLLGQNCRISAGERPQCANRSERPMKPKPGPKGPPEVDDKRCDASAGERDRLPRRAADLAILRRELRGALNP